MCVGVPRPFGRGFSARAYLTLHPTPPRLGSGTPTLPSASFGSPRKPGSRWSRFDSPPPHGRLTLRASASPPSKKPPIPRLFCTPCGSWQRVLRSFLTSQAAPPRPSLPPSPRLRRAGRSPSATSRSPTPALQEAPHRLRAPASGIVRRPLSPKRRGHPVNLQTAAPSRLLLVGASCGLHRVPARSQLTPNWR